MAGKPGRKKSNVFVWAVLGLLVVSLTGFGVRELGSSGVQSVAAVGDEKVTANEFARAMSNRLRQVSQQFGTNVTLEQARALGIDQMVMAQVLNTAALDGETRQIGLSIGDERVRDALLENRAFHGLTGTFDETTYKAALRNANLSASEYDIIIRKDAARTVLEAGVAGGVKMNDTYALSLYSFIGEVRSLTWAPLDETHLAEAIRAPSEAEIDAYYKANPETYTSLETRRITYADLTPDMLIDKIEVDEDALKKLYDSETERFNIPAQRIVDRLVMPNIAAAEAAMAALNDGSKTFDALVTERGLSLNDVDMGEVSEADLGSAGAMVFSLAEPGFAGPVETDLGPAIFRVNAVLDAQSTSFEDAKDELHAEFVADKARRRIDDDITMIDDLLAGGARLEEIASQTDMQLGQIAFTANSEDGIAANAEFRTAAAAVSEGDFPKVEILEGGGIFALRLDGIDPPALLPLAEVRDRVVVDWKAAETRKKLLELAEATKKQLEGGLDFATAALSPKDEQNIRRQSVIDLAPATMVETAYEMTEGAYSVVSDASGVAIVHLTSITPFDDKDAGNATALEALSTEVSRQVGRDLYQAFATAVQERDGVTVNQPLLNAVLAQIN